MTELRSDKIQKPGYIRVPAKCHKCGGAGGAQAWAWTGWTCYRCNGSGGEPGGDKVYAYPASWTDEQVAAHVAKREAQAIARAERKAAKIAAEHAAWLSEQPAELVDMIAHRDDYDGFVWDILTQGTHKALSERQVTAMLEAAKRSAERVAAEAAEAVNAQPLPTGTVTIEGEVLTTKVQENRFGSELKMLVKGLGWKVWGTVPRSLEAHRGAVVRFTATVEASDDDPTFGFFKRPRNAQILSVHADV